MFLNTTPYFYKFIIGQFKYKQLEIQHNYTGLQSPRRSRGAFRKFEETKPQKL